jgi:hypothetical protein
MLVAGGVVTELALHPGAEDDAESGLTADDLGVRVRVKSLLQFGLQALQLAVHLGDDADAGAHRGPEGAGHGVGGLQLGGAQRLVKRAGARLDVALAAGAPEGGGQC